MPLRIVAADKPKRKGRSFRNTRRENRLEELGRVDAEKAYTSKGKRNLRQEKSRIRKELKEGGSAKLTPAETRRKAGPSAARPVPKSIRDRLKDWKTKSKVSPGRPGRKGPRIDKRWNKGDKFMTPLRAKKAVGGVTKILRKLGKEIKKQPLPKKTKDLNKKFKKAFPHHDSKGKLKTTRPGYSSGGVVMAGKKVGCQIK